MSPREVVEHLERLGMDDTSLAYIRRDAQMYFLLVHGGWTIQDVAGLTHLHPQYIRKRVKRFASTLRHAKSA